MTNGDRIVVLATERRGVIDQIARDGRCSTVTPNRTASTRKTSTCAAKGDTVKPDLADVLAEVNRLRAERGMDPLDAMPRGGVGEARSCPLARSLCVESVVPGYVGNDPTNIGTYRIDPEGESFDLPLTLCKFGRYFDRGEYPELIA